jgi:hypothetical protein
MLLGVELTACSGAAEDACRANYRSCPVRIASRKPPVTYRDSDMHDPGPPVPPHRYSFPAAAQGGPCKIARVPGIISLFSRSMGSSRPRRAILADAMAALSAVIGPAQPLTQTLHGSSCGSLPRIPVDGRVLTAENVTIGPARRRKYRREAARY